MIDFILDNLLLLPFLFPAYLVLEWMEAHAGDALERKLGRVSQWGPFFGAAAGVVPQCGFSAAAASLYAGGAITAGTLVAVFLSTSDELIPVLLSKQVSPAPHVDELCARSRCHCSNHRGILVPALIHTAEIFLFLLVVSAVIELVMHYCGGEEAMKGLVFNKPFLGEMLGGLIGLVPNCAVSAACAELYSAGGMSPGALCAASLTGAGMGMLVLFRTHRHFLQNLGILAATYLFGVLFGYIGGMFL